MPNPAVVLYDYIAGGYVYFRVLDLVKKQLSNCRAKPSCYAKHYTFISKSDAPSWVTATYPEYFI